METLVIWVGGGVPKVSVLSPYTISPSSATGPSDSTLKALKTLEARKLRIPRLSRDSAAEIGGAL